MDQIKLNEKKDSLIDNTYIESCLFKLANNEKDAMNDLYLKTSTAVFAYAYSILKNKQDAEDVSHDVYMIIYDKSHLYKAKGKPMAWIITIVRNLCLRKLNERDRFTSEDISSYQIEAKKGISAIDKITIETCMNILSDEERQIVIMHLVAGLKHREIAQELNMLLPTVLSKYNRALKKLKKEYEKGLGYE